MAAKTSWHGYGTKLRHGHRIYCNVQVFFSELKYTYIEAVKAYPALAEYSVPCKYKYACKYASKYYCYDYARLTASFPGQPGSAGTRKVNPVWI